MAEPIPHCTHVPKRRKRILAVLIILFMGMIIGGAIGHCREGRNFGKGEMMRFERSNMMGNFGGERFEKGNCTKRDKEDDKKLFTGDLAVAQATCKANQAMQKATMQKVSALQDDYASLRRFIMRGDVTNASSRIDTVVAELNQLKTNLPAMTTTTK